MFSIKGIGILAILSFVLLGAVLTLQAIEFRDYRTAPSVWAAPRP